MSAIDQYPGVKGYLNSDAIEEDVEERLISGQKFIKVTQIFDEGEGEQFLFKIETGGVSLVTADNVVQFPSGDMQAEAFVGYEGTMSDAEHATVARKAVELVDNFKTGMGPGRGNVACMWAARRVVHKAVQQCITEQDGTSAFYSELRRGGMKSEEADDLPAGAIIISPTIGSRVGHIGLMGAGSGNNRPVFSNHSPSKKDPVARWKQNYTVGSFVSYHAIDRLRLPTYFFRLPKPAGSDLSS